MEEQKLAACPWCGGEAEIINCSVHCNNPTCEAQPFTAGQSEAEAIAAWNRRSPAPQGEAEDARPPAARKPLSEEEIAALSKEFECWIDERVIRAVEKHHGIYPQGE